MTPDQRHAAVLNGLAQLELLAAAAGTVWQWDSPWTVELRNSANAVLAGRRRILERHAPEVDDRGAVLPFCAHHGRYATTRWPCDEYTDAAADLLPEGTTS